MADAFFFTGVFIPQMGRLLYVGASRTGKRKMPELLYPTSVRLGGPWLISSAQLEAFDQIVDQQVPRLEASIERHVSEKLEEYSNNFEGKNLREDDKADLLRQWDAQQRIMYKLMREVNIQLADGKTISSKTFREAATHRESEYSRMVGFDMKLGNGETRRELSLHRLCASTLQLSVYGDDNQDRQDLFTALRQWVSDIQAPDWQRMWIGLTNFGVQWFIALIGLVIIRFVYITPSAPYVEAAHALVAKGLTPKDVTKAIEIILALQSRYNPSAWREITRFGA